MSPYVVHLTFSEQEVDSALPCSLVPSCLPRFATPRTGSSRPSHPFTIMMYLFVLCVGFIFFILTFWALGTAFSVLRFSTREYLFMF